MTGRVVIRGILEVVQAGMPIALIIGVVNAAIGGAMRSGWETRIALAAVFVGMLWFAIGFLLRNWAWLDVSSSVNFEGDHA